jgi:hypothetical protein
VPGVQSRRVVDGEWTTGGWQLAGRGEWAGDEEGGGDDVCMYVKTERRE